MIKTILGISPDENALFYEEIEIKPYFFDGLSFAKGSLNSVKGKIKVSWMREENKIKLTVFSPTDDFVIYNGKYLSKGNNEFII